MLDNDIERAYDNISTDFELAAFFCKFDLAAYIKQYFETNKSIFILHKHEDGLALRNLFFQCGYGSYDKDRIEDTPDSLTRAFNENDQSKYILFPEGVWRVDLSAFRNRPLVDFNNLKFVLKDYILKELSNQEKEDIHFRTM